MYKITGIYLWYLIAGICKFKITPRISYTFTATLYYQCNTVCILYRLSPFMNITKERDCWFAYCWHFQLSQTLENLINLSKVNKLILDKKWMILMSSWQCIACSLVSSGIEGGWWGLGGNISRYQFQNMTLRKFIYDKYKWEHIWQEMGEYSSI